MKTESEQEERQRRISDIWIVLALATAIRIARKQYRSKKDIEIIDKIESQFYWIVSD